MKYTLILITGLFLSCSKEEQCKNYSLIHESNYQSAKDKCEGLANDYPKMELISSQYVGCLTEAELIEARKATSIITKTYCGGITYTIRIVLR